MLVHILLEPDGDSGGMRPAPLRARVSDPALLPDLEAHLKRMGCQVEPVGEDELLVELTEAPRRDAAELELDLYLRLWEALMPLGRAERVA